MWVLASWLACNGAPESDLGSVSKTPDGNHEISYEDVGVACVRTTDTPLDGGPPGVEILVDFGDCLDCSTDIALSCEATADANAVVVHAGGTLIVEKDCVGDTCQPVTTTCLAGDLADGGYVLSYAGIDIPFAVPDEAWACTGPTGVL